MVEEVERHLTVGQIARIRNLSSDTVRRLFTNEPGEIDICKPKVRKRVYRELRIPESVERRVFARLTNNGRGRCDRVLRRGPGEKIQELPRIHNADSIEGAHRQEVIHL